MSLTSVICVPCDRYLCPSRPLSLSLTTVICVLHDRYLCPSRPLSVFFTTIISVACDRFFQPHRFGVEVADEGELAKVTVVLY